jgi:hypothetical protein
LSSAFGFLLSVSQTKLRCQFLRWIRSRPDSLRLLRLRSSAAVPTGRRPFLSTFGTLGPRVSGLVRQLKKPEDRAQDKLATVDELCPVYSRLIGREINLYARRLIRRLHQNEAGEFARAIESEIPPLLRKRPGFRDELVLINLTAQQAEAISLWNSQESADTFGKGSSDMLKVLGKFTKDKPQVQRFQVAKTTLHRQMEGSTV